MTPKRWVLLVLVVLTFGMWFFSPALSGFHLGCNALAGDNERETNLGLLWCRHAEEEPAVSSQPSVAPTPQEEAVEREHVETEEREVAEQHAHDEEQQRREQKRFDEETRRGEREVKRSEEESG